jgi:hypothetical protein
MQENRSFSDGLQIAWDATSVELAQTCLRKYYYRMIQNVGPKESSVHLIFGGIYASSLELFYHKRAEGLEIEAALVETVRYAMAKSYGLVFDSSAKTRPNLIRTIIWYIDRFGEESADGIQTVYLADGKPAVELSFALEFGPYLYCGHLDRVVTYGGFQYWMDQKTTGSTVSPRFFEQFSPHNQFTGYTWAGQTILHSPIKGGIIDAAQIAVGFSRFERGFVSRTQEQISEWIDGTFYTIELAHRAVREQYFPMNLSACGNYGGCPYRELCARTPAIRESFLLSNFQINEPWEPSVPR